MSLHLLLTGASRGIGRAIGARLEREAGVRLVGQATAASGDLIAADFASPGAAPALWAEALDRLDGRIDIVINNAGVFEAAPIDLADGDWAAAWARTLQINLVAAAELCRLAVRHWQDRGSGGRIINVASRAAHRGDSADHWHYAASKAGLLGMTKSIARAYAADGIWAFAVCPGFTMTDAVGDTLSGPGGQRLLADIPLGRAALPDEVAEAVRFLALDAPPSMTGAVIDINGASYVR
ncbi:NAD(P)-dependent dehydrogenase, short-chain alcohol dehydrogenase family [Sphingomonas laterariae]|uniref:NAD(P)-dependent dehydrogenase, short-chain alcohol dehydrogenase family n=1 Tax=Edaphosphingomonas laterariae TaxID=861865 RepID=A0A239F0S4_9SPHN|nr:SDR family oxidoreductase [Sphingomonas laterariae]SNS49694.1 NAD(P)-dependent dehydrogenase, short-chain alcohol dehydrogenase family [Sphingomonas laterariae]